MLKSSHKPGSGSQLLGSVEDGVGWIDFEERILKNVGEGNYKRESGGASVKKVRKRRSIRYDMGGGD